METGGKQLVSKADYARMRGWDRSYLSKKDVKARLAPAMEKDERGRDRVNVAKANEIFLRETDTAKVRKPSSPAALPGFVAGDEDQEPLPGSMDADRRKNLQLKNEDLALKLAEQKGQTLPREGVIAASAGAGQKIREALAARNRRMADRFATMTDARQILVAMEESDREILGAVSNDFMRRIQAQTGGQGQPTTH